MQLAAALVHEPELLVLDEPFSGLDPVGVDVLSGVLSDYAATGVPVVFSSHQLELVERLCEAVAIIKDGRLVASGTVEELRGPGRTVVKEVIERPTLAELLPRGDQVIVAAGRAARVHRARPGAVFLISTALTLVIIVLAVVMPTRSGSAARRSSRSPPTPRAGRSPSARSQLADRFDAKVTVGRRRSPTSRCGGGEIHSEKEPDDKLVDLLQVANESLQTQQRPALKVVTVEPIDPDRDAKAGIAFFTILILYGQLLTYGYWVAAGVVEEKSSRVIEVLLATIRPRDLLAGKVLGLGLLGFAQLMLVAALGLAVAAVTGACRRRRRPRGRGRPVAVLVSARLRVLRGGVRRRGRAGAAPGGAAEHHDAADVADPDLVVPRVRGQRATPTARSRTSARSSPPRRRSRCPARIMLGAAPAWEIVASIA